MRHFGGGGCCARVSACCSLWEQSVITCSPTEGAGLCPQANSFTPKRVCSELCKENKWQTELLCHADVSDDGSSKMQKWVTSQTSVLALSFTLKSKVSSFPEKGTKTEEKTAKWEEMFSLREPNFVLSPKSVTFPYMSMNRLSCSFSS